MLTRSLLPWSSDLPLYHHPTLFPLQTAIGTSSTRRRPYPAPIPTFCRETTFPFAQNRPISFAITQNSEHRGFPFVYPSSFFSPFLLVPIHGEYLQRLSG